MNQKIIFFIILPIVIVVSFYFYSSDSIIGTIYENYSEPMWDEIHERDIVKNSIPIIYQGNLKSGNCSVSAEKFFLIIEHEYFIRGEELADKLNYDKEDGTLIIPCDKLQGEKSRLNVWYVLEDSPKHPEKYEYFITPWEENNST
jgi:hypothetical protein